MHSEIAACKMSIVLLRQFHNQTKHNRIRRKYHSPNYKTHRSMHAFSKQINHIWILITARSKEQQLRKNVRSFGYGHQQHLIGLFTAKTIKSRFHFRLLLFWPSTRLKAIIWFVRRNRECEQYNGTSNNSWTFYPFYP